MADQEPDRPLHPLRTGLVVGAVAALVALALGFSIVAMPVLALAQVVEGDSVNDPLLRRALGWALPFGLVVGLGVGVVAGRWAARGGRLPTGRRPFAEDDDAAVR